MRIQKDIKELVDKQVISEETAQGIREFYKLKNDGKQSRLFTIFGVLGAILVGMGVVLIIAHNWDEFSRGVKTIFAFIPLILAQALVIYSKWKKTNSSAWLEGSSILLFFGVGASISLISQVYHISGNLGDYLLTWTLLALPIIYLMPSGIVAVFYLIGITYMGAEVAYFNTNDYEGFNAYWLMLAALFPFYYWLQQKRRESNFLNSLNWLIPISVILCLGMFAERNEEWMLLAYMSLFGILYNLGSIAKWFEEDLNMNGFKFLGSLGMVVTLLMASFRAFWKEIRWHDHAVASMEFYIFLLLAFLAIALATWNAYKSKKLYPKQWVFLIFIPLFFWGLKSGLVVIVINILILGIAIQTIREGANKELLGLLNYGLLIIATLLACRFFDTNLSFIVRGLLFISLGLMFFLANYWMLKRRKNETG